MWLNRTNKPVRKLLYPRGLYTEEEFYCFLAEKAIGLPLNPVMSFPEGF